MLKVLGEESGKFKAVASGTLPNGKPVVVNSDGTVSVISGSDASVGSAAQFESGNLNEVRAAFDSSNNKVVIVYADIGNSYYATAVVGTVSGTSISFGTPVVFHTDTTYSMGCTYDAGAQKIVASYRDQNNSAYGTAIVGTVSGTSISFGTPVVFESANSNWMSLVYDSNAQKTVIFYRDDGNGDCGNAIVGTVSGTSISFGSAVIFESSVVTSISATFDSGSNKCIVAYRDYGNSSYGTALVGTVSGTSISFGSKTVFNTATSDQMSCAYDSTNNKTVIAYRDGGNSLQGTAVVGTVSGTSISFGTPVVFESSDSTFISATFDPSSGKIVIAFDPDPNSGEIIVGTVSGTSISFPDPSVNFNARSDWITSVYDSNAQKVVIAYKDDAATVGEAVVFASPSSNLTAENYIGMSRGVVDPSVLGTASVYESASAPFTSIAYDSSNDKIVIAYRDNGNSNYGTAVVGTVNGTSISFGTPVAFDTSDSVSGSINVVFDSTNNKAVIAWESGSDTGKAVVGTISGTSISFGSVAQFDSAFLNTVAMTFDSSNGKVLICYKKSNTGKAVVGTVSGTSISFGSIAQFDSSEASDISASFDSSNNKVVIAYRDQGNSDYGTAVVGTISGTSVSFGTPVVFEAATCGATSTVFDTLNNKIVITYSGESTYGKAIVGTVSGTSISFGSAETFQPLAISYIASTFDSTKGQVVCLYNDSSGSPFNTLSKSGTVSGTSISFGTANIISSESYAFKVVHDPDNQVNIAAYQDPSNSAYGTAVAFNNEERGSVADGDNASMDIIGSVSTNQSGLTAGEKYYVQTDGTLSTTAGSPSVLAGTAISSNKLIVKT